MLRGGGVVSQSSPPPLSLTPHCLTTVTTETRAEVGPGQTELRAGGGHEGAHHHQHQHQAGLLALLSLPWWGGTAGGLERREMWGGGSLRQWRTHPVMTRTTETPSHSTPVWEDNKTIKTTRQFYFNYLFLVRCSGVWVAPQSQAPAPLGRCLYANNAHVKVPHMSPCLPAHFLSLLSDFNAYRK